MVIGLITLYWKEGWTKPEPEPTYSREVGGENCIESKQQRLTPLQIQQPCQREDVRF